MNVDEYGEIINGEDTYREIAKHLIKGESVGIGWTDENRMLKKQFAGKIEISENQQKKFKKY